jgi:GH15 family glucan-1,4-alpha-glucosidase
LAGKEADVTIRNVLNQQDPVYGSKYLPIAEHGLIGDLRSVALVGSNGTIDWYCCPRFDAPSVFASLLDVNVGGSFELAADVPAKTKQFYIPDTNILITRFFAPDGLGEIQDFMPIIDDSREADRHRLIRRVVCVRGSLPFRAQVSPRFGYGTQPHTVRLEPHRATFTSDSLSLALTSSAPITSDGVDVCSKFTITEGESAVFALDRVGDSLAALPCALTEADDLFDATVRYWRRWLSASRYRGRWREVVHRSALTLKLLTYAPTGAIIAAPTTSLPEQLGGERNWDYRYVWIRDAAFCINALLQLGFTDEADAFMDFLSKHVTLRDRGDHGPLQSMYGIDGRADLPEQQLDHLEGYEGSAPVRIGNSAAGQLQLDIYGALIDSIYLYDKWGKSICSAEWEEVSTLVEWVCEHWDQPDDGVWETRGGRHNFLYSRVMCWVAMHRAMRIAEEHGLPADIPRWRQVRDSIYRQIMRRYWSIERGAFVQQAESDVLDASVLMMALAQFVSATDPKWLSTLRVLGEDLVSDSLMYRYDPTASPDGLRGKEGTFSMCSFWYVEALTRAGRTEEAQLAFEKMLTYANHVGLYAEQIGLTGEQLGNFPQAFTHLGLISAALNLDQALG